MSDNYSPWTPTVSTEGDSHYVAVPKTHLDRTRELLRRHRIEFAELQAEDQPDFSVFEFAAEHAASDLARMFASM